MAIISFDAASYPGSISSRPTAWSHTCGTNASIYVVTNNQVGGVTWNGSENFTNIVNYNPLGNYCPTLQVWAILKPTPGTHTIQLSQAGDSDCGAVSYFNCGKLYDNIGLDNSGDATKVSEFSGTVNAGHDNDFIVCFGAGEYNRPWSFTERATEAAACRYGGGDNGGAVTFITDLKTFQGSYGNYTCGAQWTGGTGYMTVAVVALTTAGDSGGLLSFF